MVQMTKMKKIANAFNCYRGMHQRLATPRSYVLMSHPRFVSLSKLLIVFVLFWSFFCVQASGTELKPSTEQAFREYVEKEEQRIQGEVQDPNRFLYIDGLPDSEKTELFSRLRNGEVFIQPMTAREHQALVHVPGGLVHHWVAIAFMPGVTADRVLQLSRNYSRYGELYKPDVQDAKVLDREGEHFHVYYRFFRHTIVSVVYNAEFDVDYFSPGSSKNYSLARSTRIAEVRNPGNPNEKEYPVGNDHGYMWRLNLYSRVVERDGGVYVQLEFLSLSRTVPAAFAWVVNPYMQSIPREYLKHYLEQTQAGVSSH